MRSVVALAAFVAPLALGLLAACEDDAFVFPRTTLDLDGGFVAFDVAAPPAIDATATSADAAATPKLYAASAASGVTAEDGTGFDLAVSLVAAPTAPVTLPVVVSRGTEVTVSSASLVFDATSGTTATLQVRGVDDGSDDADQDVTVTIGPPSSADPAFAAEPALVIPVKNRSWTQVLKNATFDVAPGATVDLDDPSAWPAAYTANGGFVGSPNAPFNTIIADGFGRAGRGAKLTRATGTNAAFLPSFEQSLAVTTAAERACSYRARADVEAIDAAAKLRLLLTLLLPSNTIASAGLDDGDAPVNTWETLTVQLAGPASEWTKATLVVGAADATYFGEARADNVRLERVCRE